MGDDALREATERMNAKREFSVTACFGKKRKEAGTFRASTPNEAIVKAQELNGAEAAFQLGCQTKEITWEAEEDFI